MQHTDPISELEWSRLLENERDWLRYIIQSPGWIRLPRNTDEFQKIGVVAVALLRVQPGFESRST